MKTSFKRQSRMIRVDKLSEQAVRVSLSATIYSRYVHVRVTRLYKGVWSVKPDGDWPLHDWSGITDPHLYGDLMYLMAVYGLELSMGPGTAHSIRMDKRYRGHYTLADGIPYSNKTHALTSGWTYFGVRNKTFKRGLPQLHGYIDRLMSVIETDHHVPDPLPAKIVSTAIYPTIDLPCPPEPMPDYDRMTELVSRYQAGAQYEVSGIHDIVVQFAQELRELFDYRSRGQPVETCDAAGQLTTCAEVLLQKYQEHGIRLGHTFSTDFVRTDDNTVTVNFIPARGPSIESRPVLQPTTPPE